MSKQIIIYLLINSPVILLAQDTLSFKESQLRFTYDNYSWNETGCFVDRCVLDSSSGNSFRKKEEVGCTLIKKIEQEKDSLRKQFDNAQGHYVKFYYSNNILKEEGVWYYEFWEGKYKRYYANSVLAESGEFMLNRRYNKIWNRLSESNKINWKEKASNKIGKWEYYSNKGKQTKVETYSNKGRLLNTK
jgi:hypothetical protein